MNAPRKLAAILVADVVGYSQLTGLHEEGTLKRLRRQLINRAEAIDRRGSGVLARPTQAR
jgi:class 3 adenylate cyclase